MDASPSKAAALTRVTGEPAAIHAPGIPVIQASDAIHNSYGYGYGGFGDGYGDGYGYGYGYGYGDGDGDGDGW